MSSIRIPLSNCFARGGYTAAVHIGSQRHPVQLIIDTGSSTLVVHNGAYQPSEDNHLTPTALAQDVVYGAGGWFGPVVSTTVTFHHGVHQIALSNTKVALTAHEESQCFAEADGIMGLAYRGLNHAADMSELLVQQGVQPAVTYPHLLEPVICEESVKAFKATLQQTHKVHLEPFFTQLEEQGIVANQFGLLTHRSSIYYAPDGKVDHVKNTGELVLGKPWRHDDLYHGLAGTVALVHDKYYNVELLSVQLDGQAQINAPALEADKQSAFCSNAIIDSGASLLVLPQAIHQPLLAQLSASHPDVAELLAQFGEYHQHAVGIELSKLNLADWPDIILRLAGSDGNPVSLRIAPSTYWQVHSPQHGQATFKLTTLPGWPNQTLLGLPLLNNYYTVFDRDAEQNGVIHFAHKALPHHHHLER